MKDRNAAIAIKLAKAKKLLSDVDVLVNHGGYNSVVSRLYYACYHATTALLLTKELQSRTHKGLAALLHKEFVVKGEFDAGESAFFTRLMQERIDEDYGDFLVMDDEAVKEFIDPARKYIAYIEQLINRYNEDQQ
jgi:uncharacterized protein (UPF0332 family)